MISHFVIIYLPDIPDITPISLQFITKTPIFIRRFELYIAGFVCICVFYISAEFSSYPLITTNAKLNSLSWRAMKTSVPSHRYRQKCISRHRCIDNYHFVYIWFHWIVSFHRVAVSIAIATRRSSLPLWTYLNSISSWKSNECYSQITQSDTQLFRMIRLNSVSWILRYCFAWSVQDNILLSFNIVSFNLAKNLFPIKKLLSISWDVYKTKRTSS